MPRSKKGRISGAARQELNHRRSEEAIRGGIDKGIAFARVTKLLGANHAAVVVNTAHGAREIRARIPNVLSRRGATPITTKDIVSIFVGPDFDPNAMINPGDHFDITAILDSRQARQLKADKVIPAWMMDTDEIATGTKEADVTGFVFEYVTEKELKKNASSTEAESESGDDEPTKATCAGAGRSDSDDFDIADI